MSSIADRDDDRSSTLSSAVSWSSLSLSDPSSPNTMPLKTSSKRTIEEIVAAEESGDDDYDDKAPGPSKARSQRSRHRSKPARKRQRRTYGSGSEEGDEDEDDSLLSGSYSESEKEEEPVEMNEHGRPVRKAAKARVTYEESDVEDEDELAGQASETDEEEHAPALRSRKSVPKLIVKLKTGTPRTTPAAPTRNLRKRSGSHSSKQPPTPTTATARGTRRSSRISHDEEETLIGLSNSGNHAEVVRPGSREPEVPVRQLRGGKGLKYPSKSTIDEASQEDSNPHNLDEVLEIKASQHEIMESDPQTQGETAEDMPKILSDIRDAAKESGSEEAIEDEARFVPESQELVEDVEPEEDDDEEPIPRGRATRASQRKAQSPVKEMAESSHRLRSRQLRSEASKRPSRSSQRKVNEESSDFEPDVDHEKEDEMSASEQSEHSPPKVQDEYESSNSRRSRRMQRGKRTTSRQSPVSDEDEDLADELAELKSGGRKRRPRQHEIVYEPRRTRGPRGNVDYRILRPELNVPIDDAEEDQAPTPSRRRNGGGGGGGGWQRSLFSTYGPFGGAGGPTPILGGPGGIGAAGGADSDSSDEEGMQRPKPIGGTVGMTPTSAFGPGLGLFPAAQALNADAAQGTAGTPANLGKVKDKQALADADPLGVDQNVTFEGVGGLQGHIDQLKEMVALPLLYPEIFMRFKITPPRGVLFHGPPGTGKTLLARALASSVSSQGKKVTFYMRKGADALSKWVGEAEKQLRMLFEEARRTQPSIIFFDEIDGLAPVRSSKQEQIHASIVSTLLALMDGMDGRGQVVVIGATNRPDSVDPALRRPGRFDREFYFPLPNTEARRAILDIHTRNWDPPLDPAIKDELAKLTKGYGGADLRALCTEAALNAVQRRYPQIYKSQQKLLIDPKSIQVLPKDFMISVEKIVPSSERSASSGASPLPSSIEPLLRKPLSVLERIVAEIMPQKKKTTALEEAQYEDVDSSFGREKVQRAFDGSRVFRPRLLVRGPTGMGQQYLAAALLNHFEGLHVQSFELSVLLGDSASSPEATMVRLFSEVKTHKPSVIYMPNVQTWYATLGQQVIMTFLGLLRSLHPTDPILVLGILEQEKDEELDQDFIKQLFGYSKRNSYTLSCPEQAARREYFKPLMRFVAMTPPEFPDPLNRKKRVIEELRPAPPEEPKAAPPPTKEELKIQKKRDRHTLNMLKIQLQPIMDQIRTKYRKFRSGVIEEHQIRYLYDEADPGTVSSDLHTELLARASFRPYEIGKDAHDEPGLLETGTGKFFYNLDTVTIEKRLSNGYYKRPKDFLADVKRLAKDARTIGDQERLLKANELLTNVEVDIEGIELGQAALTAECEKVYQRELIREKEALDKAKKTAEETGSMRPPPVVCNVPHGGASEPSSVNPSTGPITLGEPVNDRRMLFQNLMPITPSRPPHNSVTTNGIRPMAAGGSDLNGSGSHHTIDGHDADAEGDTHMAHSESRPNSHEHSMETQMTNTTSGSSFGPSAQPRPPHSYTAPSQQMRQASGMSAPLSQKSTVTPMAAGSQAADYQNSASTTQTTSGKKNSGSSGEKMASQEIGPNLYMYDYIRPRTQATEMPDTQPEFQISQHRPISIYQPLSQPNSQPSSHSHSQPPPVAPFDAISRARSTSIHALLNDDHSQPSSTNSQPTSSNATTTKPHSPVEATHQSSNNTNKTTTDHQKSALAIDHDFVTHLLDDLSSRTTGCSVEQLEQVNSVLMDTVWRTRLEWNRSLVAVWVGETFNRVLEDMEDCGWEFGPSSWGRRG
ncbi:hypothetical protein GJ744_006128 [Endocarpon pusillum]|uniref:AAA+ ATPase domain-containing protein n=1 Tax=Endocarpon pusillum TaxID=364733 RepID=A0A8H7E650_9EURO|nr:hypothetical protein GJ744_006128 [Endocarpon pusillum]